MYWTRFIAKSSVSTNTTFGRDPAAAGVEDPGPLPDDAADDEGAGWLPPPAVQALNVTAAVTATPIRHNSRLGPTRHGLRRRAAGVRMSSSLRGVGERLRTRRGDRDYGPGL